VSGLEEASAGVGTPRAVNLTRVKVGCWDGHSRLWKGALDEVRFYSRALPPAEIRQLAGGTPASP
jgi:hypothetical protein